MGVDYWILDRVSINNSLLIISSIYVYIKILYKDIIRQKYFAIFANADAKPLGDIGIPLPQSQNIVLNPLFVALVLTKKFRNRSPQMLHEHFSPNRSFFAKPLTQKTQK